METGPTESLYGIRDYDLDPSGPRLVQGVSLDGDGTATDHASAVRIAADLVRRYPGHTFQVVPVNPKESK